MISFPRKLHDTEPRQEKCTFSDSLTQEGTSPTSLQPEWIYTLPDVRDFFAPFSGPVVAWRTDPRKRAEKTFSSLSTRGLFQRAMLFWSDLEGVFSDQKKRKKICSNQDNKQSKPFYRHLKPILFQSVKVSLLKWSSFKHYSILLASNQYQAVSDVIVPMNCACFMDWSIL